MLRNPAIAERGVILVAHEPPGTEHLGIRLVASALVETGFEPRILPLLSPTGLASAVVETLAASPMLVGLSISDPMIAPMMLAYARLLRSEGYGGHISAGGALATLERTRPGSVAANLTALDRLAARGIAPVINVLTLHPGCSLDDTRAELAALDQIDRFAWDVLPLTVWPGTALASDLAARGELDGQGAGLTWRQRIPRVSAFCSRCSACAWAD